MKRIWNDLVAHLANDFSWIRYGSVGVLLATLISINYHFDLESTFQAQLTHWEYLLFYLLFFPSIYYLTLLISRGTAPFKSSEFLRVSGFILLVISVNTGFLFYQDWFDALPIYERYFLKNITLNSMGLFIAVIPLYLHFRSTQSQHHESFYGLSLKRHNFKPYLVLLALMVPLLWVAAQSQDFQASYPVFKPWKYEEVFGLSRTQMSATFETVYLLDFIRVELLFRGALIIGLARFLGKDALLPMVTLYCVLHFNKPLGETISSIFGGYLLGTIALYQRNIVGGCVVHAGIAGLMELFAYLVRFS